MTALLRLLGSLDAYRREFRSRAYIDRVSRLIILGKSNPSSVSFSLQNLHYAVGTLSISGSRVLGSDIQDSIAAVLAGLDDFSITKGEGIKGQLLATGEMSDAALKISPKLIAEELTTMTKQVEDLHKQIEDVFFSHQDMFARDPVLFDMS